MGVLRCQKIFCKILTFGVDILHSRFRYGVAIEDSGLLEPRRPIHRAGRVSRGGTDKQAPFDKGSVAPSWCEVPTRPLEAIVKQRDTSAGPVGVDGTPDKS